MVKLGRCGPRKTASVPQEDAEDTQASESAHAGHRSARQDVSAGWWAGSPNAWWDDDKHDVSWWERRANDRDWAWATGWESEQGSRENGPIGWRNRKPYGASGTFAESDWGATEHVASNGSSKTHSNGYSKEYSKSDGRDTKTVSRSDQEHVGGAQRKKGSTETSSLQGQSQVSAFTPLTTDLPIDAHREKILKHIRRFRVTHIQGETGCGKSTRLPRYLLEEAMTHGKPMPRIIVTQPRRMAAYTLARRVAAECGESLGGGTVGYRISGDAIDGRLCFVTTGYLLQRLVHSPTEFAKYTHLVLDEVHERGVDADLLSMVIKALMFRYREVKLVVMSATLQASLFADYFAPVEQNHRVSEILVVGSRVHPVEQIFLDEVMSQFTLTQKMEANVKKALEIFSEGKGKGKTKGKDKGKGKGSGKQNVSEQNFQRVERQFVDGLAEVTVELVHQLAKPSCTVIVFLPGIADITSLFELLAGGQGRQDQERSVRPGAPRLQVFALHSQIPRSEQEEVFHKVPADACHVVLASNIAESSLTLPSVCAVIDLALHRTVQYDTRRLMCCLVTAWCSRSSCKQRSGRAGRTMPGRAICMVPRSFFEHTMLQFDPPEMLNVPLTKLYLQAKQLCSTFAAHSGLGMPDPEMDLSTPKTLFREVIQPPSVELLGAAVQELAAVGCLTEPTDGAQITDLGRLAIALPCDLRICRLIYVGCLLRCPADAIMMASGLTAVDPFSAPSLLVLKDQREFVAKLKRSFAARQRCDQGRFSEPLLLHTLMYEWLVAGAPHGPRRQRSLGDFASEWSVIPKKFETLVGDAMDLTARTLKLLQPQSTSRRMVEDLLACMKRGVDTRGDLVHVHHGRQPSGSVLTDDTEWLQGLLAIAFGDQMLLSLDVKRSSGHKKKRKEEHAHTQMITHRLDPSHSVAMFLPNGVDQEILTTLCRSMCGETPKSVVCNEKLKLALVTFKPDDHKNMHAHLRDVPSAVHRLHQFGGGRYKFSVEQEGGTLELFKPFHPFLLEWEVLAHSNSDGKKRGSTSVRGICDWRNPLGFACHCDDSRREMLGVCASIQGLESGSQAFVAGATVLPLSFLPVLLVSLCPEKWSLRWGVDTKGKVQALKILHYEFLTLPPLTFDGVVLCAVNALRGQIREALTAEGPELLDPPDLSETFGDLLSHLVRTPAPTAMHRYVQWCSAADNAAARTTLRPLLPFAVAGLEWAHK